MDPLHRHSVVRRLLGSPNRLLEGAGLGPRDPFPLATLHDGHHVMRRRHSLTPVLVEHRTEGRAEAKSRSSMEPHVGRRGRPGVF